MPNYVDGFVIPVPRARMAEYRKLARLASKVWLDHGALEYAECEGDALPWGKRTSFPRSVKAKEDEVIVFAWIVYRSKAHRDKVSAKAMADRRFEGMDLTNMPFDPKRMIVGGFTAFVKAAAKA